MDSRDWDRVDYENWRRHGHERGFFEVMNEEIRTYGEHMYGSANPVERWNNVGRGYGANGLNCSELSHRGRGPRSYVRNDERIREDVVERLAAHNAVDATEIDVLVQNGEVTLRGMVENRFQKRLTMDIAEDVFGVKNVINQLRVREYGFSFGQPQQREADGDDRTNRSAANLRG